MIKQLKIRLGPEWILNAEIIVNGNVDLSTGILMRKGIGPG